MDWRALEARVDGTMRRAFGENVRLSFLKGSVEDPARPAVEVRAILHVGGDDSVESGPGDYYRTRMAIGKAELFLDRATYTGPLPRKGDKVRALEREGRPWFEAATVSDRHSNLIVVSLGEV